MQVSKWQEFHLRLTAEGLEGLFSELGVDNVYAVGRLEDEILLPTGEYARVFRKFLTSSDDFQKELAVGLSISDDVFVQKKIGDRLLLQPRLPYIQVRVSRYVTTAEGKVVTGSLGKGSTVWGLSFAYPLLFMGQDAMPKNVLTEEGFPNTPLYKRLQKWVRYNTKPATIDGHVTHLREMR